MSPKGSALKTTVLKSPVLARLAAIAAGAVVLAACSAINPITTDVHYAPSDGVQVAIGDDAKALNLLVVTTAKDAPAVLTGSIYNGGAEDLAVTLSIDGTIAANVTVAPDATVQLGTATARRSCRERRQARPAELRQYGSAPRRPARSRRTFQSSTARFEQYQGIVDSIPPLPVVTPSPTPTASPSPSASPTA